MTPKDFATIVRDKTRTSTTTLPNTELLLLANTFKDEIAGRIQQERQDFWNVISTDDLVANQREYALPADMLTRMIRLELILSTGDEEVLATPLKMAPDHPLTEDEIQDRYYNNHPKYFLRRNAIYLLTADAIEDVTDGLIPTYDGFPADLTDLTDDTTDISVDPSNTTRGFPREFHELLARRVSIEYKDQNRKKLSPYELNYENDLERKLDEFSIGNTQEETTGQLPKNANIEDGYNL